MLEVGAELLWREARRRQMAALELMFAIRLVRTADPTRLVLVAILRRDVMRPAGETEPENPLGARRREPISREDRGALQRI